MVVGAAVREIGILGARSIRRTLRTPDALIGYLIQPLMILVGFSFVFDKVVSLPGFSGESAGNYASFLLPGILAVSVLSSGLGAGIGLAGDIQTGMLDKLLMLPISRPSILLGRVASESFRAALQTTIILGVGLAIGADIDNNPFALASIYALAVAFTVTVAGLSNLVALRTGRAESIGALAGLITFPMLAISTVLMPEGSLPGWLATIAKVNPVTHVTEALRDLVNGSAEVAGVATAFAVIVGAGTLIYVIALASLRALPR